MINFDRLNYIFLFLLLQSVTSVAQTGSIEGKIMSGNEPLGFATVALVGTTYGTSADVDGQFLLENIPVGEYDLEVAYLGYETKKQQISIQQGDNKLLRINLLPTANQMEEIVVTGTMKPTYVSNSPIKVDVITAKQLETFLPAAASSIVENVKLVNGVQEVVACGVCFTNSISINGLPGPYTAILMDGMPMYGNLASVYGLNGIPNMIIDRFEVIKGPSSTLYGSEAVAGVINIITKNPERQPLLSIDLMGTSHLESFGNLAVAPKIGKSSGFIGLNYAYVSDFEDINNDDFNDGINLDRYSLFTKWNIHRKSGRKFSLAGKYFYEDRRNGVAAFLQDRAYRELRGSDTVYGESIYTNRAELFGTYEFDTQPSLKLDFSLSHHDQDSYYGSDAYQANQQIAFANFLYNQPVGNHDLLFGLTARYNAYDDNSVATQVVENQQIINQPNNQFIPGVFVQDEWDLNEKVTLLSGARLDHYTDHGLIFAPRLSAKYKPSLWTTLRANLGSGFRVVNLFTEDHAFVTGQRNVEIIEDLKPEESYNATLSLNQTYAALGGTGTIDIESYFTHFTNKIIPDYETTGKIIYANSDGYARTMGVGVNITHNVSEGFGINAGVNFQRAREYENDENGTTAFRDIEFAPQWTGIFTANYFWQKQNITFGYTISATGPMALPEVFDLDENGEPLPSARATTSEPFALHNLQINKQFSQRFSLYGGIQNLTNFRQVTSPLIGFNDPNANAGFSQYFDTSYAYAPNHGREVYLGFRWTME
ncbi:MAG: TonB-dependent receptor [Saprospiraceae bacterium]